MQNAFEESEIKARWEEYVNELYNDDRGNPPISEKEDGEEILLCEVEKAIKDLKTAGSNKITSKMIKALDDTGIHNVHTLVNNIYNTGSIPRSMNESIFVRIPKKPKTTLCTEYRTLSLDDMLKVILRVIMLRNRQRIEEQIIILQSGFISF